LTRKANFRLSECRERCKAGGGRKAGGGLGSALWLRFRQRSQSLLVCARSHGLVCSRVALSGAADGPWSGDIDLELAGRSYKVEVKARRSFTTLHGWILSPDLLLLKADRQQPLAVMPLDLLAELAAARASVPPICRACEAQPSSEEAELGRISADLEVRE
jgi:hypothetical protein